MAQNLWSLESYPTSLCVESEVAEVWREVEEILKDNEQKKKKVPTAHSPIGPGIDIGLYPQNISDVNPENKWMLKINFNLNAEPFNTVVIKTLDGLTRVKTVDYIAKNERILFKYEEQQTEINIGWKCLRQQVKGLFLQHCTVFNCSCFDCKISDDNNYFHLKNVDPKPRPVPRNFSVWKKQLEINFHRAENHRNEIFKRIFHNPFTLHLRHTLFDNVGKSRFTEDLVQSEKSTDSSLNTNGLKTHNFYKRKNEKKTKYTNDSRKFNECGSMFQNKITKKKTVFRGKNDFKCDECEFVSKFVKGLQIHKYTHRRKNRAKTDKEITQNSKSPRNVSLRQRKNTEILINSSTDETLSPVKIVIEKLHVFACTVCNKMIVGEEGLKSHKNSCTKINGDGDRGFKRRREESDDEPNGGIPARLLSKKDEQRKVARFLPDFELGVASSGLCAEDNEGLSDVCVKSEVGSCDEEPSSLGKICGLSSPYYLPNEIFEHLSSPSQIPKRNLSSSFNVVSSENSENLFLQIPKITMFNNNKTFSRENLFLSLGDKNQQTATSSFGFKEKNVTSAFNDNGDENSSLKRKDEIAREVFLNLKKKIG